MAQVLIVRWTARVRAAALLAIIMLVLASAVELVLTLRQSGRSEIVPLLVYRLPLACYLAGLWTVSRALAGVQREVRFSAALSVAIGRTGSWLALGAAATVFVSPLLLRAIDGPRRGAFASFDPAAIAIGVIGLTLLVIAHLLTQAAAMQVELDEIL